MDIVRLIIAVLNVYEILIIIRALASWFNPNPYNQIFRFLCQLTDPVLVPLRKIIPTPGIDFSPMVVILLIELIKNFIQ